MDATSSFSKPSLLYKLRHDFPGIDFEPGENFRWAPAEKKVYFFSSALDNEHAQWDLFHEVGHALLEHDTYAHDITLLKMEVQAWQKAVELAQAYEVFINSSHIEQSLETYREWLNSRASCPECAQIGVQKTKSTYQCMNCRCSWRVNEAKLCSLRRYRLVAKPTQ